MKDKAALFIGHNECYGLSSQALEDAIVDLIAQGFTVFYNGGQGGFDRLCANCLYKIKRQHPEVKSYLVIPYLTFSIFDKDIFDEIIYPEGFEKYHFKAAIPARNNYMLDNSTAAICYVNHGWGGAAKTYKNAINKNLKIINLGALK